MTNPAPVITMYRGTFMKDIKAYSVVSSDFVSPLFPKSGEKVVISAVFSERPDFVLLKYDTDVGLVFSSEMKEDGDFNGAYRYSAEVSVTSDKEPFSYFFVFSEGGISRYLSRIGITRHTPSYRSRFSLIPDLEAPEWVASSTCYQIFPDRFNNGDKSVGARAGEYDFDGGTVTTPEWTEEPKDWWESRCCDFYNGDLKGIRDKAEYLKALGITAVYLNPIFSSRSVHRYDTVDFAHVDEKLGGDEALVEMVDALHRNGIKVILDISINHTGLDAIWLKKALEDSGCDEHDFYYFKEDGKSVECWQDVRTLPQLRYSSSLLRDYMYRNSDSIMKKFLLPPFSIDAWRLDVSPEVGRRGKDQLCKDVWREVRKELHAVKKDVYLVGEDWDDTAPYMQGDIWDGTMNYYGSGRPLRSWMGQKDRFLCEDTGHDAPSEEPWTGEEEALGLREALLAVPGQNVFFQMNLFDSHDTPRLHNDKAIWNRGIYKGVVMAMYMLPGMPNLYYGDEVGIGGKLGSNEGARYPMEWREEKWDLDMLAFHRALGEARRDSWLGFSSYRIQELDEKAFAVIRFTDGKAYCAVINRGESREVIIDAFALGLSNVSVKIGEGKALADGDKIRVSLEREESLLLYMEK